MGYPYTHQPLYPHAIEQQALVLEHHRQAPAAVVGGLQVQPVDGAHQRPRAKKSRSIVSSPIFRSSSSWVRSTSCA